MMYEVREGEKTVCYCDSIAEASERAKEFSAALNRTFAVYNDTGTLLKQFKG